MRTPKILLPLLLGFFQAFAEQTLFADLNDDLSLSIRKTGAVAVAVFQGWDELGDCAWHAKCDYET